jgi:uncharacterized protein (TIGR03067 family)
MLAVLTTLSFVVASADDLSKLSEAAQKELKKFDGKWKAAKVTISGNVENDGAKEVFIEFKGRKIIVTEGGKEMEFFEVAALDPSVMPKILDLKALTDMEPLTKGTVYEAIYKLDGEEFSLAMYFGEGKKRPEKFESEKDSNVVVVTFKREKK